MSVGLDVHARSVVAAALDGVTGEIRRARLTPEYRDLAGWLEQLPGPVAVTYEAGPTGFGLARFLAGAGGRVSGRGALKVAAAGRGQGEDRRPGRVAFGEAAAPG